MLRIFAGRSLTHLGRLFSTKYSDKYVMSSDDIAKLLGKKSLAPKPTV